MPKSPYKFFKPVAVKRRKTPPKTIAVLAALTLLSLGIGYVGVVKNSPMMTLKADPAVWESIINSEPTYVTVTYVGELNYQGLIIYKHWRFGDLNIIYAKAFPETLEKMVKDDKIYRISAWKKIDLPPFSYVVKNEGVTYDFSKDYKRIYHKANDRWTGEGITVAIIDTGIDYLHPDFFRNGRTIIKVLVSTVYKSGGKPLVYETEGFTEEQMKNVLAYERFIMDSTLSLIHI